MIIPLFPIVPGQLQVKTDEVVRPIVLLLPPWFVIIVHFPGFPSISCHTNRMQAGLG